MRPEGNMEPYHKLKERWMGMLIDRNKKIDMVFDSDERSIQMWRDNGVFCFDCRQNI